MPRWKKDADQAQKYRHMPDDELRAELQRYRAGEARAAFNKGRRGWKAMRELIEAEMVRRGLLD
ncbi:hypothetical protein ACGFX4_20265 [Kitasatospora sp. NPDC048365]|uniref:hypothetical protein n=1 Tax=Kitasatospora sp. NPDC048365 TaxID=3364050 RepID=UPI00371A7D8A